MIFSRFIVVLRRLLLATLALGCAVVIASGQEDQRLGTKPVTLPLRIVDGHIIVTVTLFDRGGLDEAITVELSLDNPELLSLHDDELGWLKLNTAAIKRGEDVNVRATFAAGITLLLPAKDIKAEKSGARVDEQNRITKFFPNQLDERKLKGALGLGLLKHYDVVLDLKERQLVLTPPTTTAPESGAPAAASTLSTDGADFVGTFELRNGQISLPVASPAGPSARMILGSSNYDTLIDPAAAKRLNQPAGDVAPVALIGAGELELSRLVAFRPKAWGPAPAAGTEAPLLLSGINLLESFRLEIEWASSRVRFIKQDTPPAPAADQAYFKAEVLGTADAYQAFLEAHPKNRLGADAAKRLIALRLDEWGADDDSIIKALQWIADTSAPERRTENCLAYVNRLATTPGRSALAIRAAQLSLKYSRQAITVQDVYRLHRILGEQYLEQNELQQAWTHLLSAAFVPIDRDPEHAFRVALNLARVYEKQSRFTRAYSRYKAALAVPGAPMTKDAKAEITTALERLKTKIPADELKLLDS